MHWAAQHFLQVTPEPSICHGFYLSDYNIFFPFTQPYHPSYLPTSSQSKLLALHVFRLAISQLFCLDRIHNLAFWYSTWPGSDVNLLWSHYSHYSHLFFLCLCSGSSLDMNSMTMSHTVDTYKFLLNGREYIFFICVSPAHSIVPGLDTEWMTERKLLFYLYQEDICTEMILVCNPALKSADTSPLSVPHFVSPLLGLTLDSGDFRSASL